MWGLGRGVEEGDGDVGVEVGEEGTEQTVVVVGRGRGRFGLHRGKGGRGQEIEVGEGVVERVREKLDEGLKGVKLGVGYREAARETYYKIDCTVIKISSYRVCHGFENILRIPLFRWLMLSLLFLFPRRYLSTHVESALYSSPCCHHTVAVRRSSPIARVGSRQNTYATSAPPVAAPCSCGFVVKIRQTSIIITNAVSTRNGIGGFCIKFR